MKRICDLRFSIFSTILGSIQKYSCGEQSHLLAWINMQLHPRGGDASHGSGAAATAILLRIHGLLSKSKFFLPMLKYLVTTDGVSGRLNSFIPKALHLW